VEPMDTFNLPDDGYGYGQYNVVLRAMPEQRAALRRFQESIGVGDLAPQGFVSVCAMLYDLSDMDELRSRLRSAAGRHQPVKVTFEKDSYASVGREGIHFGMRRVVLTPELQALRDDIGEALEGVIKQSTPSDGPYRPHVTLFLFATAEEAARGDELEPELDLGDGFDARMVDLLGRSGHPRGGTLETVESFPLG